MNPIARIASLHRELAEAYEELARTDKPKRRSRVKSTASAAISAEAVVRVKRELRKAGLRA